MLLVTILPVAFLALGLVRCSAVSKYLVLGLEVPRQVDHFLSTFLLDIDNAKISLKSYDTALSLIIQGENIFGQPKTSLLLLKEPAENAYNVISTAIRWSKFDTINGIIVLSPDVSEYETALRRFIAPVGVNFIQIYQKASKNFVIIDDVIYSWSRTCLPGMLTKIRESLDVSQPVALASTLVYKSFAQSFAKQICVETGNLLSHSLFSGNYSFFLASLFPIDLLQESISRFDLDITAYLAKLLAPSHIEALEKVFPVLTDVAPLLRSYAPKSSCISILTKLGCTETEASDIFHRLKTFHTSKANLLHSHCVVSLVVEPERRVPIFYSILSGRRKGIDKPVLLSPFLYYLHWLACREESLKDNEDISRADKELSKAIDTIDKLIEDYSL